MSSDASKRQLRAALRAARRRRTPEQNAADRTALRELAATCDGELCAAYVPMPGEPGDRSALDSLADGRRVILPVVRDRDAPLLWGWYDGPQSLRPGPMGLAQPQPDPRITLSAADRVIVPALALTRDGTRLGQGGGFYDRSLTEVPTERLVGVVHEDEVLGHLPSEPHDLRVGWICTPSGVRRARDDVSDRLDLYRPTSEDAAELHVLLSDPRVWTHFPSLRHTHVDQTAALVAKLGAQWRADGLGQWIARDRSTGELAGMGGVSALGNTAWNLGYRFAVSHQGRGLATELSTKAIERARRLEDRPIVAYLVEHNVASAALARKLGFALVDRLPDDGNPDPTVMRLVYADRQLTRSQLDQLWD